MDMIKAALVVIGIATVSIVVYNNSDWFHSQANSVQKSIPSLKK